MNHEITQVDAAALLAAELMLSLVRRLLAVGDRAGMTALLGEAERVAEAARDRLACVAESMTEHAYQELASALEAPSSGR